MMKTTIKMFGVIAMLGSAALLGAGCAAPADENAQQASDVSNGDQGTGSSQAEFVVGKVGGYGIGYNLGSAYSVGYASRAGFGYYGGGYGLW
jgi:hypothetical protein